MMQGPHLCTGLRTAGARGAGSCLANHTDLYLNLCMLSVEHFPCIYLAAPGLSCGMRDLVPDQGSHLGPPRWEHGVLATGSPRKYLPFIQFFFLRTYSLPIEHQVQHQKGSSYSLSYLNLKTIQLVIAHI